MSQKVNRFFPILCKYFVITALLATFAPFWNRALDKFCAMMYNSIKKYIYMEDCDAIVNLQCGTVRH